MNEPANIDQSRPIRPVALSIEVGSGLVEVRTDATRPAAVRAEPMTPDDKVALDLISRARLTDTGDRLDLVIPNPPASGSGGVNIAGGGFSGNVVIMGGDVVINGQRVGGGSVYVTAIVPPGSSVSVRTRTADARIYGVRRADRNELTHVGFISTSGGLDATGADTINARTVSGDIEARDALSVQANTTSGDIELPDLRGGANLGTVSGDIGGHCLTSATVSASAVSGDVRFTSAPGVTANVAGRTVSGKVRTS